MVKPTTLCAGILVLSVFHPDPSPAQNEVYLKIQSEGFKPVEIVI